MKYEIVKKKFKSPVGLNWITKETFIVLTKKEAQKQLTDCYEFMNDFIDFTIQKTDRIPKPTIEKLKKLRNKIGIYKEYRIKIK